MFVHASAALVLSIVKNVVDRYIIRYYCLYPCLSVHSPLVLDSESVLIVESFHEDVHEFITLKNISTFGACSTSSSVYSCSLKTIRVRRPTEFSASLKTSVVGNVLSRYFTASGYVVVSDSLMWRLFQ